MNGERIRQRAQALRMFRQHDHPLYLRDQLTRENCGACVLNGYHPRGEKRDNIDYAGWARIYVQAGEFIPPGLFEAFLSELNSENSAYANALKEDIQYWGIYATGKHAEQFKRQVADTIGVFVL